jgi:hypothetical protein
VILAGVLVAARPPGRLAAQFTQFGQNKVQYRDLEWKVAKGKHVDLYFYPEEAALAPTVLQWAEESYDSLSLKFGWEITTRIPLIVYASHSDFEQTNVLPFVPPEGILGVTDFLKHRVTLPFRGNFAEFRSTLRHEMVHVFQLAMQLENYARTLRDPAPIIPLWWTEGLAEHWSGGQDARDEMVMRDLILTGNLPRIQDLEFILSPIIYPIGGRVHEWLAATYGDYRAALFYKEAWRFETFDAAMRGIYGRSAAELNDEFQVAMRRAYLPASQRFASSSSLGKVLAGAAVKPALAVDSTGEERVVYFTAPGGYVEVASRRLDGGGKKLLLRSGRTGSMAGFHPFDSRLDASRPGLVLAGTRVEDRDALIVWDLAQHKVVGRYRFEGLISVVSPTWLPGDSAVVFSGLSFDGVSDLYRFTFTGERLERLTNDHYQDLDASASPDGRSVVFSSDRGPDGLQGSMNLFLLDLESRTVRPLTEGPWADESPRWAPNGRIYFASSRDTVLNIFSVDAEGSLRRETSSWSGAYDPTWVPGRDAILAGTFEGTSFNVSLFRPDSLARADSVAAPPTLAAETPDTVARAPWQWPTSEAAVAAATNPEQYKSKLAVDLAIGTAAYTPGRYTSPGLALLLSDLLGDHVALITASTYINTDFEGAFDNLNVTGIYLDQSHRLNWGVGGFRSNGYVYEVNRTVDYLEKTTGGFALLRYPISRFKRAEALFALEYSDRFDFTLPVDEPRRTGLIATQTLSYTFDNTAWTWTGPIDGFRLGVSGSLSTNLTGGRLDGWFLSGDWRGYLRTSRQSAFSIRTLGFYAGGERPRRINLGGSLGIRGFPWYGFVAGSRAFMVNNEYRFQLFDRLVFGLPITDINFPGIQTAFFGDVGSASTPGHAKGPLLTSYGVSWRMAMGPFAVLRLDWGERRVHGDPQRYGLGRVYQKGNFLIFFFGYNY